MPSVFLMKLLATVARHRIGRAAIDFIGPVVAACVQVDAGLVLSEPIDLPAEADIDAR